MITARAEFTFCDHIVDGRGGHYRGDVPRLRYGGEVAQAARCHGAPLGGIPISSDSLRSEHSSTRKIRHQGVACGCVDGDERMTLFSPAAATVTGYL